MKIRALLFDLDETLIEEEASNDASAMVACEIAATLRSVDPRALFAAMRQVSTDLWIAGPMVKFCREIGISAREGLWGAFTGGDGELGRLREWAPGYRIRVWSGALHAVGVSDPRLAVDLDAAFMRDRRARHVVFPETVSLLSGLRATFRLALITNGAVDIQSDKITGSRLGHFFETIVISGEHGFGKPARRIFELTLEKVGVEPGAALMIGDSLNRDIAGAADLGIRTVWVNRAGKIREPRHALPDFEIRDLQPLPAILETVA